MFQIHQSCSKYTNHVPNTPRQVLPNTLIKFSNTLLNLQLHYFTRTIHFFLPENILRVYDFFFFLV
jgi:hypothetical protein